MHFSLLTLFPAFFTSPLQTSILKKAQEKGVISFEMVDIRDFSTHANKNVDDSLYGGGAGMLMEAPIVAQAIESVKQKNPKAKVVHFSPVGQKWTQEKAQQYANQKDDIILLCGHYEGIDQRVLDVYVDEEICMGDAIFTGGEIPALSFVDSVARLLPGAIGKIESTQEESFSDQLYGAGEYPCYTRPEEWNGLTVPEVLLSGDHKKIEDWKFENLRGLNPQQKEMIQIRRKQFNLAKPWRSKRIEFYEYQEGDIHHWLRWCNDEEVTRYLPITPPMTLDDERWYYHWTRKNLSGLFLSFRDRKTKTPLGNASIERQGESRHGMFGLFIGEKDFWGKGYATEVTFEMVKIGFEIMNLEKIILKVFSENIPAQKVYEKVGFTKVGTMKKNLFKRDTWVNEDFYEMTLEEYDVFKNRKKVQNFSCEM